MRHPKSWQNSWAGSIAAGYWKRGRAVCSWMTTVHPANRCGLSHKTRLSLAIRRLVQAKMRSRRARRSRGVDGDKTWDVDKDGNVTKLKNKGKVKEIRRRRRRIRV